MCNNDCYRIDYRLQCYQWWIILNIGQLSKGNLSAPEVVRAQIIDVDQNEENDEVFQFLLGYQDKNDESILL